MSVAQGEHKLQRAHYRRMRKIFEVGRPLLVPKLQTIDLDLIVAGLITKGQAHYCAISLELTPEGMTALKQQLDAHRQVCGIHHSLGSRLAHWLRETKGRITWENITFDKDRFRRAIEAHESWSQVRVDVFACARTPTARLAATETFEVKVSLPDFRADLAKPLKIQASMDLAEAAWYCTPEGLVRPEMLPADFGLLWETAPGTFEVVKRPKRKKNFIPHPDTLMTMAFRPCTRPERDI